jgi:ferredoxin
MSKVYLVMVEKTRTGLVPIQTQEYSGQKTTEYWTLSFGDACRNGWSCRSCRQAINKGEKIAVRDGRKLRFMYHAKCF